MKRSIRIRAMWLSCLLAAALALFPSLASRALADDAAASGAATAAGSGTIGIAQITGGKGFTAVLKTDGSVWTWGSNLRGMLGVGGVDNRSRPTQVKGLTDIISISASGYHTLALKKDGTVWAWGQNTYGQLGDGTTTDRNAPIQVSGLNDVVAVAAGYYHSLALKSDGTVWSWGQNTDGQLGIGNYDDQWSPVKTNGNMTGIKRIAAGAYHSMALDSDGMPWAWGDNSNGELGNGFSGQSLNAPIMVAALGGQTIKTKQIATGYNFSMALMEDGTLNTWGLNTSGQLGNGNFVNQQVLTLTSAPTLGSLTPMRTSGPSDYTAVAAGYNFAVALEKDGTVRAWGNNSIGQVGIGELDTLAIPSHLNPTIVQGVPKSISIGAGFDYAFAVGQDGSLWGWGDNAFGQLGDGTTTTQPAPISIASVAAAAKPVLQPGEGTVIKGSIADVPLAAGDSSTVVRKDAGLFVWGDNSFGQLGNGTNAAALTPQPLNGLGDAVDLAQGNGHTAVIRSDGTVWAWGGNYFGQLGDGTTTSRNSPSQVQGLKGAVAVAAGQNHTVVLLNNGTVWTFGDDTLGQLGTDDDSVGAHAAPAPVSSLEHIVAIAAGGNFTLALQDNGTVWGWGDNVNGQLGDGTNIYKRQPVQIPNLTDVAAIAAGKNHAAALKKDGTVLTWGFNAFGQLGNGNTNSVNVPQPVAKLQNVKAIAAGAYHTLALQAGGTVWAWGYDAFGQLGDGATANQVTPVQVTGLAGVTAIAAGSSHSAAMEADGTVWTWGADFMGQLGDGTRTNRSTPGLVTGFAPGFTDVAGHWAQEAIARAAEAGYADGYSDGSFQPDRSVTRAEYVKVTAAAQHMQVAAATSQQTWYEPYVAALRAAGKLQDGDLTGDLSAPITRGEIAALALRSVKAELQKPNTALSSAYVLQTAVQAGLLQGLADGELAPQAETTRAQAVALIGRMLTLQQGGKLSVDEQAAQQAAKLATATASP